MLQFNEEMTEESLMLQLLQEALPLTLPYNSATLNAISFHPVKVPPSPSPSDICMIAR